MPDEPARVAIYTRVSTEDQAKEGFSLASQRERLNAYCAARGWQVVKEYVDEGHSGRSIKRPAYERMMEEKDAWDILLVMKMDRIHRNSKNFMEMMDHLNSAGKEFNSMSESLDTSTAMGRFVMDIIQRIAQLESEQIGERVFWGMEQKAAEGKGILGFQRPYGYDLCEAVLVPRLEEAVVVQRIFELYDDECTVGTIAEVLDDEDAPTKAGGRWARQTVTKILANPVYCGFLRWNGHVYPNGHPALVDVELFNRVQQRRYKRSRQPALDNAPLRLAAEQASAPWRPGGGAQDPEEEMSVGQVGKR